MDEVRFWSKALDPIDILAYSTKKPLNFMHPDYMQLRMHFQVRRCRLTLSIPR
jgi:hypothetical protein